MEPPFTRHIGVFGHSLCEGMFKGHEDEISAALGRHGLDVTLEVHSKVGSSISWAKAELEASNAKFDSIVLYTGVNDLAANGAEALLSGLFDLALKKCGGKVYIFNIADYDDGNGSLQKIRGMNAFISEYASRPENRGRVSIIDINGFARKNGDDPGVLHPAGTYSQYREFFISEFREAQSFGRQPVRAKIKLAEP